jgi:hypothetical protein
MRIEDSTGKFIEVTGGEASKVLEGLINSIKGATNNTARIGNDKVSEKLEELTKTTAKDAKKLKKAIEDLPEEFAKSFTKEVGKIGDWIEEIRDFMKEMAKKRGKKASGLTGMEQLGSSVKKNPFKKDLQPLEKLMEGIQTATEKTERIFGKKGSGYTHDIYCQQELQKANGFLAEILNALTKGRRSGPPPVPRRTPPPLPGNGMTPNAAVGLTPGANGGLTPAGDNGRQLQIDLDDVVADLGEANKLSQELADYLARTHRHSRYWAQDLNEIAEKGAQIAISMDKSGEAEEKIIKKHERQAEILTKASEMWNDLLMKDKDTDQAIASSREEKRREELSEAKASDESPDFAKQLWDRGVAFLERNGTPNRQAKAMIGKWRKFYQDTDIFDAFAACSKQGVVDPIPWIAARLNGRDKGDGKSTRSETRLRAFLAGAAVAPGMGSGEDCDTSQPLLARR